MPVKPMSIGHRAPLPNGAVLTILPKRIMDAALGRDSANDYRVQFKTSTEAHRDAVRPKLDRMNVRLWWIGFLLLCNLGAQFL